MTTSLLVPLDAAQQLAGDLAVFQALEAGAAGTRGRCWQAASPVVVVGRHGVIADEVIEDACDRDGVPILRRVSGGGAVVLGPGCLNYAVVLSADEHPALSHVATSFQIVLGAVVDALAIPGLTRVGSDLVLGGRKVSGNAQRRGRRAVLHHGTLLYDFDPALATRYLREPARQPGYRAARPHADFLGNIPLSRNAIRARVERAWTELGRGAAGATRPLNGSELEQLRDLRDERAIGGR